MIEFIAEYTVEGIFLLIILALLLALSFMSYLIHKCTQKNDDEDYESELYQEWLNNKDTGIEDFLDRFDEPEKGR